MPRPMLRAAVTMFVGFVVITAGTIISAEDALPAASPADIQRWMSQLSDDAFDVREEASRRLIDAGLSAKAAVSKGLEDADAEVRVRCRKILAAIDEREDARRVRAFLDEKDPAKDHGLGGWKPFRAAVGDRLATRKLFVEMYRAESPLLKVFAKDVKKVNELFATRMNEIQQALRNPIILARTQAISRRIPLGTAAALLFAAGEPGVSLENTNAHYLISQSEINTQLQAGDHRDAVRTLLGRFVGRELSGSQAVNNFNMALRYDLKQALGPALKFLPKAGEAAHYKSYALMVVAKFGDGKHADAVRPLLAVKTQIYSRRSTRRAGGKIVTTLSMTTQMRDVALAAMIMLHGGKVNDFGFAQARSHPQMTFYPYTLGFSDDAQREAALRQFDKWVKERP